MSSFRRKALIGFFGILVAAGIMPSVPADQVAGRAFTLGRFQVKPGESFSGYLPVPEKDGVGTEIPVTIINGMQKGKILALVAGTHGAEYPPILALYRVKNRVDPKQLSGTLVLVHIANLPSFQRRLEYYNPYDWKNLNRVFPGTPDGTLSQRLAYVLTEEVIKKCDALIDMHCGDQNEALIPYTYWTITGDKAMDEAQKQLALAFGIKTIIIDTTRTKDSADSKYLGNTAILRGKPALTTEYGYLGKMDEESVSANFRGAMNVMRYLKMLPGEAKLVEEPIWIDQYEVVNSNHDGLWTPLIKMGQYVTKGQKVGVIRDFLGRMTEELRAPFSGVMMYIVSTPPTSKGEALFEVGRVKEN